MKEILLVIYIVIHALTNQYMLENTMPSNMYEYSMNNSSKPEITKVELLSIDGTIISDKADICDIYESNYLANGVVGLVGAPIEIYYHGDMPELKLTFYYEKSKLRGIPERNLIVLYYDEEEQFFTEVDEEDLDEVNKTVSIDIDKPGIYLLADCYEWYSVWGVDMSDYAYDIDTSNYDTDWERECNTGTILDIADIDWAMENEPYFYVSTKEQLAGVVYYVNGFNKNGNEIHLYLEDDIDLSGEEWVPMGWLGATNNSFVGLIDGQGHTISNMNIREDVNNHAGFVAYSPSLDVKNITFDEARVKGAEYTGIIGGEIYGSREWENVHVIGYIESDGTEVGSLVGREAYINFKNCSADVRLKRSNKKTIDRISYYSHRYEVLDNTPASEDFKLTLNSDGSITRTELEGYTNLCWHIENDGTLMLQRGAENEITLPVEYASYGTTIWLEAFTGETYTRVSNVIEK